MAPPAEYAALGYNFNTWTSVQLRQYCITYSLDADPPKGGKPLKPDYLFAADQHQAHIRQAGGKAPVLYLEDDFDPTNYTIAMLRGLFAQHNMKCIPNTKTRINELRKPQMIDHFYERKAEMQVSQDTYVLAAGQQESISGRSVSSGSQGARSQESPGIHSPGFLHYDRGRLGSSCSTDDTSSDDTSSDEEDSSDDSCAGDYEEIYKSQVAKSSKHVDLVSSTPSSSGKKYGNVPSKPVNKVVAAHKSDDTDESGWRDVRSKSVALNAAPSKTPNHAPAHKLPAKQTPKPKSKLKTSTSRVAQEPAQASKTASKPKKASSSKAMALVLSEPLNDEVVAAMAGLVEAWKNKNK